MKTKILSIAIVLSIVLGTSSCASYGNPGAIAAGGLIGGASGSLIGGAIGGPRGSWFGSLVGTVAGAAIANSATAPRTEVVREEVIYDRYNHNTYRDGYRDGYDDGRYRMQSHLQISNVRFDDANGNGIMDAQETCYLIFEIENRGRNAAYNVSPVISLSDSKNIKVSSSQVISYMAPGDRLRYRATMKANKKIRTGEVNVEIFLTESNGAASEGLAFSLLTQRR